MARSLGYNPCCIMRMYTHSTVTAMGQLTGSISMVTTHAGHNLVTSMSTSNTFISSNHFAVSMHLQGGSIPHLVCEEHTSRSARIDSCEAHEDIIEQYRCSTAEKLASVLLDNELLMCKYVSCLHKKT